MAWLRILGSATEQTVPIEKDRTIVGRGTGADVWLPDRKASAAHCRIDRSAGGFEVFDLESQNGTWVNGKRIRREPLRPGDILRIGATEIRFEASEEEPPRPQRSAAAEKALADVEAAFERFLKSATEPDLARARERLRQRAKEVAGAISDPEADRLRKLLGWIRRLTDERDVNRLLALMLDSVVELTGADRGFLYLLDRDPRVAVQRGLDAETLRKPAFRVAVGVAEAVSRDGQPVVSTSAAEDPRIRALGDTGALQLRSVACVPIRAGRKLLGSLYLDNRFERGLFQVEDLPFLLNFADQAAVALENARLHEEAARARREVEDLNRVLRGKVQQQESELKEVQTLYAQASAEAITKYRYDQILARSPVMRELFLLLDRVTDSNVPVFLMGESGTGKELAARAIHFNGPRRNGPFIAENCAAIPENLFESELFGYVRGAFTGAAGDKKGLFQLANAGTLFLDEVADMPLPMQAKLLRVLQEKEIRPLGGRAAIQVDVRIITASNRDIVEMVRRGQFREDLFHRIHVVPVEIPPLRRRVEDIPLLVDHFLKRWGKPVTVTRPAMDLLERYAWPGNVRELENEIQRACALCDGVIRPETLSEAVRGGAAGDGSGGRMLREAVAQAVREVERSLITEALRTESGNKSAAARRLGVSRPTLDAKIEALNVPRHPA